MNSKETSGFDSLMRGLAQVADHQAGFVSYPVKRLHIRPVKALTGADVKHLRKEIGLSQGLLAEFLGVTIKAVQAWEANRNPVPGPVSRLLPVVVDEREYFVRAGILPPLRDISTLSNLGVIKAPLECYRADNSSLARIFRPVVLAEGALTMSWLEVSSWPIAVRTKAVSGLGKEGVV